MTGRIAYLVSRYPKISETFIVDEIAALERQGVTVQVYSLLRGREPGVAPGAGSQGGVPVFANPLSPRWLAAQVYWLLRAPRRLLGIWLLALSRHLGSPRLAAQAILAIGAASVFAMRMQRSRVEHVHAHWATHSALAAWAIRRLTGLPYSFTAHADDIFVRRPMLDEKVRDAEFVVTISEFNRRFLVGEIGEWARGRLEVIHCGVATNEFVPFPPPDDPAPFTILCVARLEEKKGHRHLLEACRKIDERGIEFRCLLVGEGRERSRLERQRAELGLDHRVDLLGAQSRDRVRELLVGAHVFALASVVAPSGRAEGIPVALMEAMAMQRPVVSTRISGIPELVEDERSGLLVDFGDANALSDALMRLHTDPALAARLAKEGRRVVCERFELDRNVQRLRALFGETTVSPGHGAGSPRITDGISAEIGVGERTG